MKRLYFIMIMIISFFLNPFFVFANSLDDNWGSFKSTMSGIGDGIKDFGEGIAESFGKSPPGFHYSFRVFNNSSKTVTAKANSVKKVQGMAIKGSNIKSITLEPSTDSGSSGFNNISYYLDVVLDWGTGKFTKSIVNAYKSLKNDTKVYAYNVYETKKGIDGEFLGEKTTTNDFLASIYNSLDTPQTVTFTYGDQVFSTKLDPKSFNSLLSVPDIPHCLRPATGTRELNFGSAGSIKITANGLGIKIKNQAGKETINPSQYHYEIIGDGNSARAVTAGFGVGHYTQVTTSRIRNITPVKCLVWNESAEQMSTGIIKGSDLVYIDQPKRSVWVAYATPGWSNKTAKLDGTIMAQVPLGKALEFYVMRPLIDGKNYPTAEEILHTQNLKPNPKLNKIDTSALDVGIPKEKKTYKAGQELLEKAGIKEHGLFGQKEGTGLLDAKPDITEQEGNTPVVLPSLDVFAKVKAEAPKTNKADLYIVSLDTTDEKKAKEFLQNLLNGKVAIPAGPTDKDLVLTDEQKMLLMSGKSLPAKGILHDKDSGVSGLLLAHDIFTPSGRNFGPTTSGAHYYSVRSPYSNLTTTLYVTFSQHLSEESLKNRNTIFDVLREWVTAMASEKTVKDGIGKVRPKVEEFLKKNGKNNIFKLKSDGTVDKTAFSRIGIFAIDCLLTGSNSLMHLPVIWTHGINYFTYSFGKIPTNTDLKTKKSVVTWKPSGTVDLLGKVV